MNLTELLSGVDCVLLGGDTNIKSLTCSSKDVDAQGLFFCIQGAKSDGHDYVHDAIKNGAVAVITERRLPLSIPQVIVKDTRSAMSVISGNFYGNPVRNMKLITITGTNGKTSTTYIVKSIAEAAGIKAGIIGTTGVVFNGENYPASLTTPDPIELNRIFASMYNSGVQWVIMEVSAHAIALKKMDGIVSDIAAFTNLSRDHLDFFGTMDRYKSVKTGYFDKAHTRMCVINADDPAGVEIMNKCDLPCFAYGVENPSDIFAINYKADENGLSYVLNLFDKLYDIKFRLPGRHNLYNTLCAALICRLGGIQLNDIARGIAGVSEIPGRFNIYKLPKGATAIIDYAHTPDGINNILNTVLEFSRGRVITVFGCGGDRDKQKRALMGKAAGALSEYCILTSDNPRTEDPESIMSMAEEGIKQTTCKYEKITDRAAAIRRAVEIAGRQDIIVIAGKGDEPYIDINGKKIPYSDKETLLACAGLHIG